MERDNYILSIINEIIDILQKNDYTSERYSNDVEWLNEKAKFFAKAIACISPKQAGLTVLESMGYWVPFVSTENAITGGELLNVHDGIDGVVMKNENELVDVVRDIALNREKYIKMGEKAQEYYNNNRTPEHMAQGLWDAVQYAISH